MIIRRKHTGNFTTIGNALFNDERLKADEIGIIGYLLSRPHDWQVRRPQLARRFGYGREAIKRVMWNGMRTGWIVAEKTQLADGRIHVVYEVRDNPGPTQSDDEIRRALSLGSSEAGEDRRSEADGAAATGETGDPPEGENRPPPTGDPATGQPDVAHPATANPYVASKKEATKDGLMVSGGSDARARCAIRPEAFQLAEEIGVIAGYPKPIDWPEGWCGAPQRVEAWLAAGWNRETALAVARSMMASKRDGPPFVIQYFEKAISREMKRVSAPLPTDIPQSLNTPEARHASQGQNDWRRRRDAGHEARQQLRDWIDNAKADQRSGTG